MGSAKDRLSVRGFVVAVVVGAVLSLGIGVASAHYVYSQGYTFWTGQDDCVQSRSEVSHGSHGTGYYKGNVWAQRYGSTTGNPTACGVAFSRPPHYMRIHLDGWRQPWGGTWGICFGTAGPGGSYWITNSSSTSALQSQVNHTGPMPTCGEGYYATNTIGEQLNGTWKGGGMWSGSHWLPT